MVLNCLAQRCRIIRKWQLYQTVAGIKPSTLFSYFRSFSVPHPSYSLRAPRNVNWLVHVRAKHLGPYIIPFFVKKTTMHVHYYFFPSIYIFWKRKSSSLRKLRPILSLTPTTPSLRLRPLTKVTAPFNISSWQSGF